MCWTTWMVGDERSTLTTHERLDSRRLPYCRVPSLRPLNPPRRFRGSYKWMASFCGHSSVKLLRACRARAAAGGDPANFTCVDFCSCSYHTRVDNDSLQAPQQARRSLLDLCALLAHAALREYPHGVVALLVGGGGEERFGVELVRPFLHWEAPVQDDQHLPLERLEQVQI